LALGSRRTRHAGRQIAYEYGAGFYRANASIAVRSAEQIVPKLIREFRFEAS